MRDSAFPKMSNYSFNTVQIYYCVYNIVVQYMIYIYKQFKF